MFFRVSSFNQFVGALLLVVMGAGCGLAAIEINSLGLAVLLSAAAALLFWLALLVVSAGVVLMIGWFRVHFGWRAAR